MSWEIVAQGSAEDLEICYCFCLDKIVMRWDNIAATLKLKKGISINPLVADGNYPSWEPSSDLAVAGWPYLF